MHDNNVRLLAKEFEVSPEAVRVLNAELPGNDFYYGLSLRSLGVSIDYILELNAETGNLAQVSNDISALRRMFPKNSVAALAGLYLDSLQHNNGFRDATDGLFGDRRFVSLYAHSSDSELIKARGRCGFPHRDSYLRSAQAREEALEPHETVH